MAESSVGGGLDGQFNNLTILVCTMERVKETKCIRIQSIRTDTEYYIHLQYVGRVSLLAPKVQINNHSRSIRATRVTTIFAYKLCAISLWKLRRLQPAEHLL